MAHLTLGSNDISGVPSISFFGYKFNYSRLSAHLLSCAIEVQRITIWGYAQGGTPMNDVWHGGDTPSIECPLLNTVSGLQKQTVKAKFHHAILVADRSEAGRRPASSC